MLKFLKMMKFPSYRNELVKNIYGIPFKSFRSWMRFRHFSASSLWLILLAYGK